MARNEQLIRQHKVLQILERVRYGKTLEEIRDDLVDELGLRSVSTRTVRRDLEALQAAGVDVDVHDNQRGKVWKLGPRAKATTKISFTSTEIIALSMGRQLMHPLAGTPFWMGIESFWQKIKESVPSTVLDHYQKFRKTLLVHGLPAKSYEKHQGMIKTLRRCVMEHRVCEISYQTPGKAPKIRKIEPYSVVLFQSSLYIIGAACEDQNQESRVRSWKLDRFHKTTALDDYFKVPKDLDLDQFVGQSVGMFVRRRAKAKYKIHVTAEAKLWVIEDPLHADQKVKEMPDGSIELTVPAVHDMEIIPRVLSMGKSAQIISPRSARDAIAQLITEMAEKYDE